MKKIISMILVVVMLITATIGLTACEDEDVIKFYHTMGKNLTDVLDKYIVEFNKLYPDITIKHEQVGSYDDVRNRIATEISIGKQPNIAYVYPDHVALYNLAKSVQTLDEFIDSTESVTRADGTTEVVGLTQAQKDDFIQGYYNEGAQFGDNKMYSLPLSKSTEVLYYNKTFFEANSLTVPKTWDEMETLCAAIKVIDKDSIPLGYDSESNWFITMTEQLKSPYTSATGEKFLFDNAENKEFATRYRDWYQKGYVTTQALSGAYTSELFKKTDGKGRSYMSIGSSAGATHQRPAEKEDGSYPFDVGITSIPQVNEADPKVISQGPSLTIFKKSDPAKVMASWLFVKFLTTNVKFQAEFSMASGYVPVLKSVEDVAQYQQFLASANGGKYIAALSTQICLDQQAAYYTSPAFNGSSVARDQVGSLLTTCMSGKLGTNQTVAQFIDAAFKEAIEECKYQAE